MGYPGVASEAAAIAMKARVDASVNPTEFKVGDLVLEIEPKQDSKLTVRYRGPYTVLERKNNVIYMIQRGIGGRSGFVHVRKLKKFDGSNTTEVQEYAFRIEEVDQAIPVEITAHRHARRSDPPCWEYKVLWHDGTTTWQVEPELEGREALVKYMTEKGVVSKKDMAPRVQRPKRNGQ